MPTANFLTQDAHLLPNPALFRSPTPLNAHPSGLDEPQGKQREIRKKERKVDTEREIERERDEGSFFEIQRGLVRYFRHQTA